MLTSEIGSEAVLFCVDSELHVKHAGFGQPEAQQKGGNG